MLWQNTLPAEAHLAFRVPSVFFILVSLRLSFWPRGCYVDDLSILGFGLWMFGLPRFCFVIALWSLRAFRIFLFVVCASGLNVCLSSVRASVLTYGPEELPMFFWGS